MGLFTQNLILAAHSIGVESCLQASVTNYAREIKKFPGLAERKKTGYLHISGLPGREGRIEHISQHQAKAGRVYAVV